VPASWIDFVRTPAPASAARGHDYGAQGFDCWNLLRAVLKAFPASG